MTSRLSQLTRHLSQSNLYPNLGPISAAASRPRSGVASRIMASSAAASASASASADQRNTRTIHTAACLIIGDEVLGGKNLKRVEVIEDDESEIIEAVRRMSDRYDFVVTRHDDITYQSIARAFGLRLKLHPEAYERMKKLSRPHKAQPDFSWDVESPAKTARLRMVELPVDESRDPARQVLFPRDDFWVPVAVVNGNVHILPGVPKLFEGLLEGLKPFIIDRLVDPHGKGIHRVIISTPMPESAIADYLTKLAAKVGPRGVKVGSYPRWGKRNNTVTLVGRDQQYLESLVPDVVANVNGKRVAVEGEDEDDNEPEGGAA
ncbi:molybdopterin binding domain-containing protein [Biscogniauxia sp. FL1348]|nr:molybdopterin binding domain-containing protein [Biscogniauxia sp. FL1348]